MIGECSVEFLWLTLLLERIARDVSLVDVDNAVYVEMDLLAVGAPVLISEAVGIFAVAPGCEGVVAVGHALLVGHILTLGVLDLHMVRHPG